MSPVECIIYENEQPVNCIQSPLLCSLDQERLPDYPRLAYRIVLLQTLLQYESLVGVGNCKSRQVATLSIFVVRRG